MPILLEVLHLQERMRNPIGVRRSAGIHYWVTGSCLASNRQGVSADLGERTSEGLSKIHKDFLKNGRFSAAVEAALFLREDQSHPALGPKEVLTRNTYTQLETRCTPCDISAQRTDSWSRRRRGDNLNSRDRMKHAFVTEPEGNRSRDLQ